MSPDNAAIESERIPGSEVLHVVDTDPDGCAECESEDMFDAMSDRDLLLFIARGMAQAVDIATQVQGQVGPVVDKLSSNPLIGGLFGGFGKR